MGPVDLGHEAMQRPLHADEGEGGGGTDEGRKIEEAALVEEQRISGGQILASKLAKGKRGAGREEEGVLAGSRPPVAGSRPPVASPAEEKAVGAGAGEVVGGSGGVKEREDAKMRMGGRGERMGQPSLVGGVVSSMQS
ncbi:unnamed protein product [Miscanthus lutarioriparius]|uniref:Uncharacterized protein n=1 Tax=Miscanthus lutarioriparius TaxID=422564 RepID=A0A811N9X2_9POAL|nr:unnamed protein product [Miscanthus lutarioriparius]